MKVQLVELRKGSLVDRFSVKGELSEVIEKLKKLYVCQIELTQDLIAIIHHFSMKMYSNRRQKLKEFAKDLEDENN